MRYEDVCCEAAEAARADGLLHTADIEPFLDHPYAQMRSCVGSVMAAIARVSWDP